MRLALGLSLLLVAPIGRAAAEGVPPSVLPGGPRTSPVLERAQRLKLCGIVLSFVGLAVSVTGGVFTIVNGGFDRETSEQRLRFGLGVGLAIGAVPIITTGITLWARGAVTAHRERQRLALVANGLVASF